jgi:hypothetical protein
VRSRYSEQVKAKRAKSGIESNLLSDRSLGLQIEHKLHPASFE